MNRLQVAEQFRKALQMFAASLSDEKAMEVATIYDPWVVGKSYAVGDFFTYGENSVGDPQLYKVVQAHTSQADWTPDVTVSLYAATMVGVKATIAAFFAAIGTFLGWKGIMAIVWLVLMAMDWFTGTAAARKNGTWKSSAARDGAWHKAGSVIVILLAFIADFIMSVMLPHIPVLNISWPEFLAPLVLAWYIVTELGSILENAIKLGAPVPSWIVKIFDATLKMADTVGEKLIDGQEVLKEIVDPNTEDSAQNE